MIKFVTMLSKVKIHSLTYVLIILSIITAQIGELAITLLVVVVHELGHACAANFFNWKINRINILPFGGELDSDHFGISPFHEELIVVIFGPLMNVLILFNGFILNENYFVNYLLQVNLLVLVANLLPIWPLDGGKLVNLFLTCKFPFRASFIMTLFLSIFFLALLGLFLLFSGFELLNGWIFFAFLAFAIWKGFKQKEFLFYRFLLSKKNESEVTLLKVNDTETVFEVIRKLKKGRQSKILVMKKSKCIGIVEEHILIELLLKDKQFNTPIWLCI